MKIIKVVCGVIYKKDKVLIARRRKGISQEGKWEFPGGKLAPYETARQALFRELNEDVGIEVQAASPLIRVHHQYPERNVLLDVWAVEHFTGEAYGREGQAVRWVQPEELNQYSFPEANKPILKALSLPDYYLITGEAADDQDWLNKLSTALESGVQLVQLRAHELDDEAFVERAQQALELTREAGARLILNADPSVLERVDADGVHLTTERLSHYSQRPISNNKLLSCACHNATQLEEAVAMNADLATLSPVQETVSHPGVEAIGWQKFNELIEQIPMPVFALGGMGRADIRRAKGLGGQGVAGIRAFWPQEKA